MTVSSKDMKRALSLLAGPGFGHPGMTLKEAVEHLVSEGMNPQKAYLAVQAGANLARSRGIKVHKRAGESMDLRKKVIRLAHENPELRPDLLPLLAKTGGRKTVHKETQALLKKLWKEMEGAYRLAGDLQKKFNKMHGDLEDEIHEKTQAAIKNRAPDVSPMDAGDDWNISPEGEEYGEKRDYVDWAQQLARDIKDELRNFERDFDKLEAL